MQFKTLYGPVRSGRLGLSLGVDLLGRRICSLDCIYCEVGPTRILTLERRAYMPARIILDELQAWKQSRMPRPEIITLGGLGEPCLNTELETIISGSRAIYPDIPVAVLTNSTLLHDSAVRRELSGVQVILPSLDTLVPEEFLRINKPCVGVGLEDITTGLLAFRAAFSGQIFLEVLLIRGINDSPENLERLRDFLPRLEPDRVDVVTMTRPGASPLAAAVNQGTLNAWRAALSNSSRGIRGTDRGTDRGAEWGAEWGTPQAARTDREIASSRVPEPGPKSGSESDPGFHTSPLKAPTPPEQAAGLPTEAQRELVLNSLRRRPQTIDQVCAALSLDPEQTRSVFAELAAKGAIHRARERGEDFYQAAP